MQVNLEYTAQLRRAAGVRWELIELPEAATLQDALHAAVARHGAEFQRQVLTPSEARQPTLLCFRGEQQVSTAANPILQAGETITLMSPISGG
jgi:molybdopterin converting factor small subunit